MDFGPPHASDADIARIRELHAQLAERDPDALSAGERALVTLMTAAEQIGLGGFEQLFYFEPEVAAAAPAAAELVQARKLQAVLERANAIAFAEPPRKRSQSEYRRMMRAVESDDRIPQLDDEFDALMADRSTRIEAFLARYVERAPSEFAYRGADD